MCKNWIHAKFESIKVHIYWNRPASSLVTGSFLKHYYRIFYSAFFVKIFYHIYIYVRVKHNVINFNPLPHGVTKMVTRSITILQRVLQNFYCVCDHFEKSCLPELLIVSSHLFLVICENNKTKQDMCIQLLGK